MASESFSGLLLGASVKDKVMVLVKLKLVVFFSYL